MRELEHRLDQEGGNAVGDTPMQVDGVADASSRMGAIAVDDVPVQIEEIANRRASMRKLTLIELPPIPTAVGLENAPPADIPDARLNASTALGKRRRANSEPVQVSDEAPKLARPRPLVTLQPTTKGAPSMIAELKRVLKQRLTKYLKPGRTSAKRHDTPPTVPPAASDEPGAVTGQPKDAAAAMFVELKGVFASGLKNYLKPTGGAAAEDLPPASARRPVRPQVDYVRGGAASSDEETVEPARGAGSMEGARGESVGSKSRRIQGFLDGVARLVNGPRTEPARGDASSDDETSEPVLNARLIKAAAIESVRSSSIIHGGRPKTVRSVRVVDDEMVEAIHSVLINEAANEPVPNTGPFHGARPKTVRGVGLVNDATTELRGPKLVKDATDEWARSRRLIESIRNARREIDNLDPKRVIKYREIDHIETRTGAIVYVDELQPGEAENLEARWRGRETLI